MKLKYWTPDEMQHQKRDQGRVKVETEHTYGKNVLFLEEPCLWM